MQHDSFDPGRLKVLRDLEDSALNSLRDDQMLTELEAKAYFWRACREAARLKGLPQPPWAIRLLRDGTTWYTTQAHMDDAGRALPCPTVEFLFWTDLMDRTGPWVEALGVEEAHQIADLIAFDETLVGRFRLNGEPCDQRRTVCMKALYPVAPDEEPDPYGEAEQTEDAEQAIQRFRHRLKSLTLRRTLAFEPHDMGGVAMTEPREVFEQEVQRIRVQKGLDVDSEFFAAEGAGAR